MSEKTEKQRMVQLKDQSTSFHDFDTGFDIARSQRKPLGDTVGRQTAIAIQAGRLIEVTAGDEEKPKKEKPAAEGGEKRTGAGKER